jgi:hypothetical protein
VFPTFPSLCFTSRKCWAYLVSLFLTNSIFCRPCFENSISLSYIFLAESRIKSQFNLIIMDKMH